MSNCSNCFNGCAEITSDKCVKYTGINIPELEIEYGDTLLHVETKLIEFLKTALDGTGIIIAVSDNDICNIVRKYLPSCEDFTPIEDCVVASEDLTAENLFIALVKAACDLQVQIDGVVEDIAILNADYTIGCLTEVTASSDTHNIVQAIITKLCLIDAQVANILVSLSTQYVTLAGFNSLVQAYLNNSPTGITKFFTRMVPFTVVEYYGPLTNFNDSGVGIGDWEQLYLCNGSNGTPDKRGRSPIGVTNVKGGSALSDTVNPGIQGNPNYTTGTMHGANTVTLSTSQIPFHTHNNTVTIADPGHTHNISFKKGQADQDESGMSGELFDNAPTYNRTKTTQSTMTGISANITNASSGGGLAHSNVHPVLPCNYIMYIPN